MLVPRFAAASLLILLAVGSNSHSRAATFSASGSFETSVFDTTPPLGSLAGLAAEPLAIVMSKRASSSPLNLEGTVLDAGLDEVALDVHVRSHFTCLRLRNRRMRSGWNGFVRSTPLYEPEAGPNEEAVPLGSTSADGEAEVLIADEELTLFGEGQIDGGVPPGPIGITPVHATFATNWPASSNGWSPPAYSFGDAGVGGVGTGGGFGGNFSRPRPPRNPPDDGEGEGPGPPPNTPTPEPASIAIWSVLSAAGLLYARSRRLR
jgi:hypothetical protein